MAEQGIPPSDIRTVHDMLFGDQRKVESTHAKEAKEAQRQLDRDVLATFGTPAGQRVWQWLWKVKVFSPTFDATLGLDMGTTMGFAAEGRNALIDELYKRMERAKGEKNG